MDFRRATYVVSIYLLLLICCTVTFIQVVTHSGRNKEEYHKIITVSAGLQETLHVVERESSEIQAARMRMLFNNDADDIAGEMENIRGRQNNLKPSWKKLEDYLALSGRRNHYDSIAMLRQNDEQFASLLLQNSQPGNDEAIRIYYGSQLPAYNAYFAKLEELRNIIQEDFERTTEAVDENVTSRSLIVNACMLVTALIMITGLVIITKVDRRWIRTEQTAIALREQEQINQFRLGIRGQEEDRNILGKELHDNVNQMLATVKLSLSTLQESPDRGFELIPQSMRYINEAIEEIRALSRSLVNPVSKNISLREAITELVETVQGVTPKTVFNLYLEDEDEKYVNPEVKINVYRIVQEQVNNIFKHAEATEVNIFLTYDAGELKLTIEDNGKGFDPRIQRKGIGVNNIHNRALAFDGEAVFDSSPGRGCVLSVTFPVR